MNKYLLVIIVCFFCVGRGVAQTLITATNITNTLRLEKSKSPYVLNNHLTIATTGTLIVEPGVEIRVKEYNINVYGVLTAVGSSSSNVQFVSSNKTGTVFFKDGSNTSKVENCSFTGFNQPIYLEPKAQPLISKIVFNDNRLNGVYTTHLPGVNNLFEIDTVYISGTYRFGKVTFRKLKNNSIYILLGGIVLDVNDTLIIQPGVNINLNSYDVNINGTLLAEGTLTEAIIFSSNNKRLYFQEGSNGSKINNSKFTGFSYPIYIDNKAQPTISKSTFIKNRYNGVYCNRLDGANNITEVDTVFFGSISGGFKRAKLNKLGNNGVFFATSGLTVNSSDTLLLQPGVRINTPFINVSGTLVAEGTEQDSIFFLGRNKTDRITFSPGSSASKVSFANFSNYLYPIYIYGKTKPTISRINLVNNTYNGVGVYSYLNGVENLSLINGNVYLISIDANFKKANLQNLGTNGAYILAGSLTISLADTLIVEAGSKIKSAGYFIYTSGILQAIGTERDSIFILGNKSESLIFNRGSSKSTLRYVSLSNMYTAVGLNNPITISHSTIKDSNTGLSITITKQEVQSTSFLSIKNNLTGVKLQSGQLNMILSEIKQNAQKGVEALDDTIVALSCFWGSTTGPYHVKKNPNGQGNSVSNRVGFSPWLPQSPINTSIVVFPNRGGNGGDVTINIYGIDIKEGSRIILRRLGQNDIIFPEALIRFPEPYRMQIVLDLRGKPVGEYDIVLTDLNNQQTTIKSGFKIELTSTYELTSDIIGQANIRSGVSQLYTLIIKNKSNIDLKGLPVYILVSRNAQFTLTSKLVKELSSDTLGYIDVDTVKGKAFQGRLYMFLLAKVSSQTSVDIQFDIKSTSNVSLTAWVLDKPFYNSPINRSVLDCGSRIMIFSGEFLFNFATEQVNQIKDCSYGIAHILDPVIDLAVSGKDGDITILGDLGLATFKSFYTCFDALNLINPERYVLKAVKFAVDSWLKGYEPYKEFKEILDGPCANIFAPKPNQEVNKQLKAVRAVDPNDKLGPQYTSKKHISGSHLPVPYQIRFENDPKFASAAAQVVEIIDTLNKELFDLKSFQLKQFYFGKTKINVAPGQQNLSLDIDLRKSSNPLNLILRIKTTYDDSTGIIDVVFISLDPVTMRLTHDALAGFLPVNQFAPEGEGGLFFTVNLKNSLPNLTKVNNKAYIKFDQELTVVTPVWTNIIDAQSPKSYVLPLPTVSANTNLNLRLRGNDNESGISYYDLYYSVNRGAFRLARAAIRDSVFQFVGKIDSTYRFYSIACDSVFNQESIAPIFDAETTIKSAIESIQAGNWNSTTTWSCNCIPQQTDAVAVNHSVFILTNTTVRVRRLIYRLGSKVEFGDKSHLYIYP